LGRVIWPSLRMYCPVEFQTIAPANVFPPAIATKIEEAVADVVKVWSGLQVRIDITDQRGFTRALDTVEAAITKVAEEDAAQEPPRADLQDLRTRPA